VMADTEARTPDPTGPRLPYTKPALRVFGTVAAMTAAASMSGAVMDGGPNNLKT
jgi:hypothetical protein